MLRLVENNRTQEQLRDKLKTGPKVGVRTALAIVPRAGGSDESAYPVKRKAQKQLGDMTDVTHARTQTW